MYKPALTSLLFLLGFTAIFTIPSQPVIAAQLTLDDGGNSASFNGDSDGDFDGFTSWVVNSQIILDRTGIFYQVGNIGTAETLDTSTLTRSSSSSGNSATINYGNASIDDFTLDLELSLSDNGTTLEQIATVKNTSDVALDFNLYSYYDLNTSIGNSGDTVAIDGSTYAATQSGDLDTIITTVEQTETGLNGQKAEVDLINDNPLQDTLQRLLNDNPELNNNLGPISNPDDGVSFAYEWNYNLGVEESFQITTTSSVGSAAVPFEFSPTLGLVLSGIFSGGCYLKRKIKMRNSHHQS